MADNHLLLAQWLALDSNHLGLFAVLYTVTSRPSPEAIVSAGCFRLWMLSMSEYQYYEFVTTGGQLTREQMDQLRNISTRADISSTRFCNTYNYSDLKAQPERMLAEYFDLFVYVSNFAYQRFMVKLPKSAVDARALKHYFPGDCCSFKADGKHWLLEFCYSDENGCDDGWVEGEGWMSRLLSIRAELMMGDYRSLYIAWLAELEYMERCGELPAGLVEPPLPPGLDDLSASQSALCEFLRLSPHLVKAGAEASNAAAMPDRAARVSEWVACLDLEQSRKHLQALLLDESGEKRAEIIGRLMTTDNQQVADGQRTTTELKERAAQIKADALAQEEREELVRLQRHVQDVAAREPAWWSRVEELLEKRGSYSVYDELSKKIGDLLLRGTIFLAILHDK